MASSKQQRDNPSSNPPQSDQTQSDRSKSNKAQSDQASGKNSGQGQGGSMLSRMDDQEVTGFHWKVMLISGMGFFTDAYDLFIIGVVMSILKDQWHPSKLQVSLVTSTALLSAAIGALLFGRIADMLGRKKIYGIECLVLSAGAVASAFSPNIVWLIILRFILGIGIGGDYPVSATIMSEYAGKRSRGMLVALVFAMQAAGLIVGPLLAAGMLSTHLSHNLVWRILLAVGALPPMLVFYWRRRIHETPRFLLSQGKQAEFETAAQSAFTTEEGSEQKAGAKPKEQSPEKSDKSKDEKAPESFWHGFKVLVSKPLWMKYLIGASAAWFLMDFAYYGNTVSSPAILNAIRPHGSLLKDTLTQLMIFTFAAAPGYFVAAWTMDKIGRKLIQCIGFGVMAASFAGMALIPGIESHVKEFLALYALSFFFTEFGPNATTFIYPAELFPVQGRTTGHGVASAMGKLGGFVGVFLFPFFMRWHGLMAAELAAAIVSVLGIAVTVAMLPETKGKSLEEVTEEKVDAPDQTKADADRKAAA